MNPPRLRDSFTIAALLTVAVVPASAGADESERPPTWDMSLEELQAIGLGQSRGDPIPVPADAPKLNANPDPQAGGNQGVIFVNFDGAQIQSGNDNSVNNVSQIWGGSFAAYGAGAKRDAVMQAVAEDWAAYNVVVTDARPASAPYTMNMTGPTNFMGQGVLGVAPLDCNDQQTHNNITYAFHSANDQFSASTQATTIGQEVAHSYGLEHVDEPGDIMNPYNAGGDPAFTDQCIGIVQQVLCGSQHSAQCGSQTSQNSHQELLDLFGPGVPDTQAPTITITAPLDGAEYDVGANFEIVVEAMDDNSVQELTLFNNGMEIESDVSAPWGWSVTNVPEGSYEFFVTGSDLAGNTAESNVVVVNVFPGGMNSSGETAGDDGADGGADGGSEGGGTDGGADAGDGGGEAGGDGDGTGAADDGALPPGFGLDRPEVDGCACTSGDDDVGNRALMLGLLGLVGVVRRRRAQPHG
jgi:MYXO-CTERM domain-containing protein